MLRSGLSQLGESFTSLIAPKTVSLREMCQIWSFSGPNWEIPTRKSFVFGHFSRCVYSEIYQNFKVWVDQGSVISPLMFITVIKVFSDKILILPVPIPDKEKKLS